MSNKDFSAPAFSNGLTDEKLIGGLKAMRRTETNAVTEILKYLIEVERRHLHLRLGYPSVYDFCMKVLKYSKDEAYYRIQAMGCMKSVPAIESKIESGALSLTIVAKAQVAFKRQAKLKQPLMSHEKSDVMHSLLNVGTREAERILASQFPASEMPKEKIKPIADELSKIEFVAPNRLVDKLEKLKHLLAHKNYEGRLDVLIEQIADIALKKLDPDPKPTESKSKKAETKIELKGRTATMAVGKRAHGRPINAQPSLHLEEISTSKISIVAPRKKTSRYISVQIKRQVWKRARNQCEYRNHETGLRCHCQHGLQIDHIHEFSRGGKNILGNLQLLCGPHNRWKSGAHPPPN